MKAAVLSEFDRPLEITELPRPEPRNDEVLIRVRATGLCGTDIKLQAGAFRDTTRLPLVPGHEVAGELVDAADELRERPAGLLLRLRDLRNLPLVPGGTPDSVPSPRAPSV